MHSKSDNIEIMINIKVDKIIKHLFQSLLSRYQIVLDTSMKASEFVFNCVQLLHCKCHKINQNPGGSYIDSLDWIKNKKAKINSINKKDNKCFQYAIKVALNHEKTKENPERTQKIKP